MAKTPTDIRSLARSHTDSAVRVLVNIMQQPKAPQSARVAAATALLDRGWGKPPQYTTGSYEEFQRAMEMSDDELASIASRGGNGAVTPTNGTSKPH